MNSFGVNSPFNMVSASAWSSSDVNGNNVCMVVGGDDVLVVDTKVTPGLSSAVLSGIRKVTHSAIKYVVLTHYRSVREFGFGNRDHYENRVVIPEEVVSEFTTLPQAFILSSHVLLGKLEVQMLHLDFGSYPSESMVWIPSEGTLILGNIPEADCLLEADDKRRYVQNWLYLLRCIESLNVHTIVPSHGAPMIGASDVAAGIQDSKDFVVELCSKVVEVDLDGNELKSFLMSTFSELRQRFGGPLILCGYAKNF